MTEARPVTIIGAGICGLACAYRLGQLGIAAIILESSLHAGGVIETSESDGYLFESGPQSFQGSEPMLDLARDLGLVPELQIADPAAPRFIIRDGCLRKLPMSPPALLTSSLLSVTSRWKLVCEPLRRAQPPVTEESVGNFIRRKFSTEILDYLVAPFVSGVYAGDPEQLSLNAAFPSLAQWERDYGSVVRGAIKSRPKSRGKEGGKIARPSLCSFRKGVATLPRALANRMGDNLKLGTTASEVRRLPETGSRLLETRTSDRDGNERNISEAVVIATPAYAAGNLVRPLSPELASSLSAIPYAPVAVVANGYNRQQVNHPLFGFGFLIPRKEKIRTLGTVWNSSLFSGRGPDGTVTMTSFIGGATDLEITQHSDLEIAQIVQRDNATLLGINGRPVASKIWNYPRALPQYNLRHGKIVEAIREGEQATPGVFFAGNYLEGPALGKCIENGFRTAETVAAYLGRA